MKRRLLRPQTTGRAPLPPPAQDPCRAPQRTRCPRRETQRREAEIAVRGALGHGYRHTDTHTHTETQIHTHRYTQIHTQTHTRTHRQIQIHRHTHIDTHTQTHRHRYTDTHTQRHTDTHTQTQTQAQAHIHWLTGWRVVQTQSRV